MRSGQALAYLLRDRYLIDDAAPLTTPRTCEPGPGTLVVVENDGTFTITGGKLVFTAQATPAFGDQGWRDNVGLPWTPGLCFAINLNMSAIGGAYCAYGFFSAGLVEANMRECNRLGNNNFGILTAGISDVVRALNNHVTIGVLYNIVIILRSAGAFYFIKGGNYTNWTLVNVTNGAAVATVYPGISNFNQAGEFTDFRVLRLTGALATDTGIADSVTAAPAAGVTASSAANAMLEFTWTPAAAETLSIYFRRTDDDNCWRIDCAQAAGTIKMYMRAGGVDAEVDPGKVQVWAVGTAYRIRVYKRGRFVEVKVNNTGKCGVDDATQYNVNVTGVKVTGFATGSNLICWPYTYALPNF